MNQLNIRIERPSTPAVPLSTLPYGTVVERDGRRDLLVMYDVNGAGKRGMVQLSNPLNTWADPCEYMVTPVGKLVVEGV